MTKAHDYVINLHWTGNKGSGTSGYRAYGRSYVINVEGKHELDGSSDPHFMGDKTKYNPEEMMICALSSCHLLTYLHLCSDAGIVVTDYTDQATGVMIDEGKEGGYFRDVTLHPTVTITDGSKKDLAIQLHERAHALCFIARSVNFPVKHVVEVTAGG